MERASGIRLCNWGKALRSPLSVLTQCDVCALNVLTQCYLSLFLCLSISADAADVEGGREREREGGGRRVRVREGGRGREGETEKGERYPQHWEKDQPQGLGISVLTVMLELGASCLSASWWMVVHSENW